MVYLQGDNGFLGNEVGSGEGGQGRKRGQRESYPVWASGAPSNQGALGPVQNIVQRFALECSGQPPLMHLCAPCIRTVGQGGIHSTGLWASCTSKQSGPWRWRVSPSGSWKASSRLVKMRSVQVRHDWLLHDPAHFFSQVSSPWNPSSYRINTERWQHITFHLCIGNPCSLSGRSIHCSSTPSTYQASQDNCIFTTILLVLQHR